MAKEIDRTYFDGKLGTDDLKVTGPVVAGSIAVTGRASVLSSIDVAADPASIAAAASGSVALAVPGALATDQVLVTVPAGLAAGLCIRNARVSAADVVTVELGNYSAAPVDAAATTFRVSLIR